ncbi:MAG: hypothetical protein V1723_04430 [Candidatus Uhrbacteria bacterium]
MNDDLRARLERFRLFAAETLRDFDRLSVEQQELLRSILARVEREEIERLRASLHPAPLRPTSNFS